MQQVAGGPELGFFGGRGDQELARELNTPLVVIIVQEGEEANERFRDDLLLTNMKIVTSVVEAAAERSPNCILLIVANPLDAMAQRAYQVGLVQEVVPLAQLLDKAHEMADVLAELPPLTLAGTVEAIWKSLEMDRQAALDYGLLVAQRNAFTEDYIEGRKAFAEKRKAQYKNR